MIRVQYPGMEVVDREDDDGGRRREGERTSFKHNNRVICGR